MVDIQKKSIEYLFRELTVTTDKIFFLRCKNKNIVEQKIGKESYVKIKKIFKKFNLWRLIQKKKNMKKKKQQKFTRKKLLKNAIFLKKLT